MDIIKQNGIVVSTQPLVLSSGEKSNYYYDLKMVLTEPVGATLVGELLFELVTSEFGAKSVGGLEMGAVPIASAIIISSIMKDSSKGIKQFIVRRNVKDHGSRKSVEGHLIDPVVVVDDVMTRGNSVINAIEAVRNEGYSTRGVAVVIDREVPLNQVRDSVKCLSIFKHSDFSGYIVEKLKHLS